MTPLKAAGVTQSKTTSLNGEAARMIVAHPYRRFLVVELEPGETVSVTEAVHEVASRDPNVSSADAALDESVRRRITIDLVHNHLPRLDEHDIVEYDSAGNEVALATGFDVDQSEDLLEALVDAS